MVTLDASALIALILNEPGAHRVAAALGTGETTMSTVNYAETLQKLTSIGADPVMVENRITSANVKLIVLDRPLARLAAQLYRVGSGLGIGDRACLATAKAIGSTALTADRIWTRYASALGVEVELIRAA